MEPEPTPPPARTLTIGRVMRDVAILGIALTGLAAPQNPFVSTFAFFALCYFAFKLVFFLTPDLTVVFFGRGDPGADDELDEPDEGIIWQDD